MTIHLEEIATWKTTRRPYLGNGVTLFVLGSSLIGKDTYRGMQSTIGCRSIINRGADVGMCVMSEVLTFLMDRVFRVDLIIP